MKFTYKARTKEGRIKLGEIEASSRRAALDVLEKYGLYVTSLQQESTSLFSKRLSIGRAVSQKDLVIFARQLSIMLKSAIPPLEAFRAQVAQTSNPDFRERIVKMSEAVETGSSLSQAFSMYPKIFDTFFVSIIKSGEATGKVADSLNYLADHLERDYNFRKKITGAMLYPGFVVGVFLASGLVVIFFVVPKLSEILKGFGENLPFATKMMIGLADFIKAGGWVLAPILLIPAGFSPFIIKKSDKAKAFYHRLSLKLPILGNFYKKLYLSRFGENLSVLITSGLPITQALKITKDIISNTVYKNVLEQAEKRVSRGEKISEILKEQPKLFPAFVTQMTATGEETGRLDNTLMEMVRFYQAEIERTTDKITTILEPILILVLGIAVAILAFAVFIPLFNVGLSGGGV